MVLLAALLLTAHAPVAPPPPEMRGLWVVRTALTSPQSVDQVVDRAARAGFNALFVQVRGRGDALYGSRLVPRSPLLAGQPTEFDPLGHLIERARLRGLEVHAWTNVLLTANLSGSLPEILVQHPDWLMVPRGAAPAALRLPPSALPGMVGRVSRGLPDVEGFYLSPANPNVRRHLEQVIRELVRGYPVDGLHLDFLRFPGSEFDYSRSTLEAFRLAIGSGDLLALPSTRAQAFGDFQRNVLTTLADDLSRAARAERPGIVVSAAVVADDAVAVLQKFQNWPDWARTGILDAVCPMAYTTDNRLYRQQVARACERAGAHRVWAGIGAYKLSAEGMLEKVRLAREAGAVGIVVFSHDSLQPDHVLRLRDTAFPSPVSSPLRGPAASTRER